MENFAHSSLEISRCNVDGKYCRPREKHEPRKVVSLITLSKALFLIPVSGGDKEADATPMDPAKAEWLRSGMFPELMHVKQG